MTHYQTLAQTHWERYAPTRVANLPDPTLFFQELGAQVHQQVTELAASLAGPDLPQETTLQKAGRLNAARMQAEEVVLTELVWIQHPELSPTETREAWELDRTPDSWLASWAEKIQESPQDQTPSTEELAELAAEWMLPTTFLQALLRAPFPAEFLTQHRETLRRAADRRYQNQ